MFDVVRVSSQRLIGEIIEMHGDRASIQVYEETSGLGTGAPVESTGEPMSVELGPGLIGSIFDGIQRPLDDIMKVAGNNLSRGVEVPPSSATANGGLSPRVKVGDQVKACDIIGTVQETDVVVHKIMVPNGVEGEVTSIHAGEFTVTDTVCTVKTAKGEKALTLMQRWPVRRGSLPAQALPDDAAHHRAARDRLPVPPCQGRRGGDPGPFGSGKTVTQHQLAKWAEADIVVYIAAASVAMR